MKKIMAFVLSIMMILTVAPGLAMAAQTKDAGMDEALNVEGGTLTFEDTDDWAVAEIDERVVVQSQNHDHDTEGILTLNVTVEAGDVLTYDYKVSSEEGYDGLLFAVNGGTLRGYSGEMGWAEDGYVFETAGDYEIAWVYTKDVSDSSGDDCAWLDNVYVGENTTELVDLDVPQEIAAVMGETTEIEVAPIPAYAPLGELTFESADEEVATVDEDGVITPVSVGETEITVTSGEVEAYINVNVVEGVNAQAFLIFSEEEYAEGLYDVELVTNTIEMKLELGAIFAAELVGDYIYAYSDEGMFYVIDAVTYEIVDAMQTNEGVQDMTFNYSDMTMYGITSNASEEVSDIVSIDLETGEITVVDTLDFYALTIAARGGKIYVMSYETGILYNVTDDEEVMETGVETAYVQTMSFDHATGALYWLGCSGDYTFAAMIDVELADMMVLNYHEYMCEYAGLMFPTPEGEVETVPVTGVTLDKTELDMVVLEEAQLTATVAPEDATNKRVTWTTSDETVATVSNKGLVKAVNAGTATITVTTADGEFTATCEVTVTGTVHTLLYEDFEDELEGWTGVDADGDELGWLHWINDDTYGEPYEGVGYIHSASYYNQLGPLTPDNWLISPMFEVKADAELSFYVKGQDAAYCEEHYSVYLLPEGYTNLNEAIEVYEDVSSADWERIVVELDEYVGQKVHVAFRHYDITDMFMINLDLVSVIAVELPPAETNVTGVTLDKTEAALKVGETVQLTATVAPEDATNKELVWTTSDAAVATVSETGLVTAVAAGTATITVTTVDGEFTATCAITVTEAEPEYILGDVNGDGVVNTGDAVMILRHVAELIELTPEQLLPADANKDDVVNTGDAVAILRFAAGIITEF